MKLNLSYKIYLFIKIILLFSFTELIGNESIDTIDQKVKKLTLELRCMTCQNQSIYDSEADFSNDIKKIIRDKFEKGENETDIKKFLVQRYGEYILFRPLINYNNSFLWVFPFILLLFGLFFIVIKSRKNKA